MATNNNYPTFVIDDIFTGINGAKHLRGIMLDCMRKAWPGKENISKRWAFAKNYEASAKDFLRDAKKPTDMQFVLDSNPGVAESQCRFQLGNLYCHVNRPTYKTNWNYDKCEVNLEDDAKHIQEQFEPLRKTMDKLGKTMMYPELAAFMDNAKAFHQLLQNIASTARKKARKDGSAQEQTPFNELPIDIVIEGFVGDKNKRYEHYADAA